MPLSHTAAQALDEVNAMSDHRAQVDKSLNLVSQNLQGPYAIKRRPTNTPPLYSFDIPDYKDKDNPQRLHALTGMTEDDCKRFITANKAGNEDALNSILQQYGIGEPLGQGGFRRSFETDRAYIARMTKQVNLLKSTMEGGANVLSIQEQPYLDIDNRRYPLFKAIMENAGYVSVANQSQRDVGIWVKKELKPQSHQVDLPGLRVSPLRGCAAEVAGILCINLHADRASNKEIVDALLKLKDAATNYAHSKKPPLRISITGDTNLFQLNSAEKQRLEANGFTTEMVKGQESIRPPAKPTYEAFFEDKGPPHEPAKLSVAVAAPTTPAPSAHSAGVPSTGNKSLQDYIQSRQADSRVFFGYLDKYFGGHDKATKVSAATKLSEYRLNTAEKFKITKKEYEALKQGRLKDIASKKLNQIGERNIEITPDKTIKP